MMKPVDLVIYDAERLVITAQQVMEEYGGSYRRLKLECWKLGLVIHYDFLRMICIVERKK